MLLNSSVEVGGWFNIIAKFSDRNMIKKEAEHIFWEKHVISWAMATWLLDLRVSKSMTETFHIFPLERVFDPGNMPRIVCTTNLHHLYTQS